MLNVIKWIAAGATGAEPFAGDIPDVGWLVSILLTVAVSFLYSLELALYFAILLIAPHKYINVRIGFGSTLWHGWLPYASPNYVISGETVKCYRRDHGHIYKVYKQFKEQYV